METEVWSDCKLCQSEDIEVIDEAAELVRCRGCGFVFNSPRPTLREIEAFYSRAGKFDHWIAAEREKEMLWRRRLKLVRRHCASGALLDVGAGMGQFLHIAREHFEVYGTEVSDVGIELARERYSVELTKGDMAEVAFQRKFDVITIWHVLEHVEDPGATLRVCHQLLNDGGFLFISVPNDVRNFRLLTKRVIGKFGINKLIRHRKLQIRNKYDLPTIVLDGSIVEIHLQHFTPGSLGMHLEQNGFEVVDNSIEFWKSSAGLRKLCQYLYYLFGRVHFKITGTNLYDVIYIVARRKASNRTGEQ